MSKTFLKICLLISLILAKLPANGLFAENTDPFFTLIALPDTQNYVKYHGAEEKFYSQTNWIVENKDKLNIKFVLHLGDITDNNSVEQWEKAKQAMQKLNNIIPYALCVGNHDIGYSAPKGVSRINDFFPTEDFEEKSWWGGKMPDNNCFWYKFDTQKHKFIIISLDLGANDKMLQWADNVLSENSDRLAILITHELLDEKGKLSDKNTKKNAAAYGTHPDGSPRNTGEEVWKKHISKHPNYILALCGHYNGIASRTELKGEHGNTVHILMSNYQYSEGGGNGFLRIMKFYENSLECEVSTYSPYLNKYWNDEKNNFKIKMESLK